MRRCFRPEALNHLEHRALMAAGGGFANAGLIGEYFDNPALSGVPSFTRKDVRIDFDWGTTTAPGGSSDPGYRDVGTDNYSVRWSGQVIPRFSETYTFRTTSDDGVRLFIKPAGSSTWTTLIDDWSAHWPTDDFANYSVVAGNAYDLKLEYFDSGGGATIKLKWSSPSTPEEVIDPVAQVGIFQGDWTAAFTDIVKGARNGWWGAPTGADGWPAGDGGYVFQESLNQGLGLDPLMRGTVTFSFHGRADVSIQGNVDPASLTYIYDAASNTTTGSFAARDNNVNASFFNFRNSHRDGQPTGPAGITDLKLMRPIEPDATTSYTTDTLFTPEIRDAISHFTLIRYQLVANLERDWSERTLPGYFNQSGGQLSTNKLYDPQGHPISWNWDPSNPRPVPQANGASWEYKILLANETGRDLMVSIPPLASDDYVTKLAQLIRYGSDGVTPYTSPHANPAYPPLNPNLRVYFEIGNELWNWGGPFYIDWQNINALTAAHADARDADFRAFNYDGLPTTKDGNSNYSSINIWSSRETVLRTVQMSDLFRSVFGDGAMMTRVRPLHEWQYANANGTAQLGLTWADNYLAKADPASTYAGTPQPVNHWIWGGGGATYYGAANPNGLTGLLPDPTFNATTVPADYNPSPAGTAWTFSAPSDGTSAAGIYRLADPANPPAGLPAPYDGNAVSGGKAAAWNAGIAYGPQYGYITDRGSITGTFTVPASQTSNVYAVSFKAVNRGGQAENLRVFVDGVDVTARTYSQGDGYTPPAYDPGNPWKSRVVAWALSDYYATKTFTATPGSTHTVTIKGMGDVNNAANKGQTAFVGEVRITSADAIFDGGFPGGGEAAGQPAGQDYRNMLNAEVNWAKAYGLEMLGYEGGWSLGGDDGGSPLQVAAKYGDARAADVQAHTLDMFRQAGAAVSVLGTYAQWPSWADPIARQGLLNAGSYPIVRGIDDRLNHPAAEPTNGAIVPGTLTANAATLADGASGGRITSAGGWMDWNVLVPRTGTYSLVLTTSGAGGSVVLLADGAAAVASKSGLAASDTLSGTVLLTAGLHTLKVRSQAATAVTVGSLTVTMPGAPAAPVLNPIIQNGSAFSLSWDTVSGASGYKVRITAADGTQTAVDVGGATAYSVSNLTDGAAYTFAVSSYNATAESLSSAGRGAIYLAEGHAGTVAAWNFRGIAADAATAPVSVATPTIAVGDLTRGSGAGPGDTYFAVNRFIAGAIIHDSSLAGAVANDRYIQFTLTPNPGMVLSLSSLQFTTYLQNVTGSVAVRYSTDGSNFTTLLDAANPELVHTWTVDLSGRSDLQDAAGAVIFRVYVYGMIDYTTWCLGSWSGKSDLAVTGSTGSATVEGGTNQAPTVVTPAAVTPAPVTGTTAALSVLGADDGGEANLTYTWSTAGTPPTPVTFAANGTNTAKATTAAFARAGTYQLLVTIADAGGLFTTSSVTVVVQQTLSNITVSPATATLAPGAKQLLTATALDQFGDALDPQPGFSWSVLSGSGNIDQAGVFTAPATPGTTVIKAASGAIVSTATITTTQPERPPVLRAIPNQTVAAGQSLTIAPSASDPDGDRLVFSARVDTQAYVLEQQYGFYTNGNYRLNRNRLNEKWFLSANNQWFYILPSGVLYQSNAGKRMMGTFIAQLDPIYYADPTKLFNARPGGGPAAVSISGSILTVTPNASFRGTFYVYVTVSDGRGGADAKQFRVTVL